MASLFGAALTLGCVGGCADPDPETFRVQVISIDAHGGPSLPEDRVQAIVRRALAQAPSFASAERDQRSGSKRGTLVATFEYRELPDASDHGRDLMVRLSVETPPEIAAELGAAGLDVTVLLEREAGQADLSGDLRLATERLVNILQARTDLARDTEGSVARLLGSSDPDALILTLEWVRDHADRAQARDAADRAVELINHADERVALLAIEALGQIGGPEHVGVLLDRIQLADTRQANSAYDALANLGGPEAEGFLQFAARNEDEPRRRAAAERALHRVADSDMVQASSRAQLSPSRPSVTAGDGGLNSAAESGQPDGDRAKRPPTWQRSRGHR
ncbi:hypothetical protein DB30_08055 [Enhygromyxa salina]|uniref:HEAT repeat domain-containing protein n=1 Tax=Enhygromyxa salina TaxID=215803 RepID=A0A0C1Z744_9BACT|nr:HEAT repeat domain-containing protein [Enhygromyxa salina]KIG13459.1 hypothetical protein DB30_08055 [Enhygromyxa salina]